MKPRLKSQPLRKANLKIISVSGSSPKGCNQLKERIESNLVLSVSDQLELASTPLEDCEIELK